jgi:hypothetical protein
MESESLRKREGLYPKLGISIEADATGISIEVDATGISIPAPLGKFV